ncbi:MAG: hypothetical protein WCJ99_15540 [Betaproteobacteria bacterium]
MSIKILATTTRSSAEGITLRDQEVASTQQAGEKPDGRRRGSG